MNTHGSIRRSVNGPDNRAKGEHTRPDSKHMLQEEKSTTNPRTTVVVTKRNKCTDEHKEVPGVEGNSNRKGSPEPTKKRSTKRSKLTLQETDDKDDADTDVLIYNSSHSFTDAAEKVRLEQAIKRLEDEKVALDRSISEIAAALAEEVEKKLCIICYNAPRDTVLFPCGHLQCCSRCSEKILDDKKQCPTCRSQTIGHIKLTGL